MRYLLCGINAKYIHSNLAIFCLKAYARCYGPQSAEYIIKEYTINQYVEDILADLYQAHADVIIFSCYIWNISYVRELAVELKKICPYTPIWVGGPEVSYHAESFLKDNPAVDLVMQGEGEDQFCALVELAERNGDSGQMPMSIYGLLAAESDLSAGEFDLPSSEADLEAGESNLPSCEFDIPFIESDFSVDLARLPTGVALRVDRICGDYQVPGMHHYCRGKHQVFKDDSTIVNTGFAPAVDMDRIPFVYDDFQLFDHKIIYYESSRGCPFSCSYCLSSIDKTVRFRSLSLVLPELQRFLDAGVPQVKFVDRTFNCRKSHAMAIWSYIYEHDNSITNFHFEISADLLDEEELRLFEKMRPGLIQLEIGVQSTYGPSIDAIRRHMNLNQLFDNVDRVHAMGNIHQHLDLIAGLPYETFEHFKKSFNDIYAHEPDQLQLGFLKVLKGTYMEEKLEEYGMSARSLPPYEVLKTRWLSYEEILRLKGVEEMVETYYNSMQYTSVLKYTVSGFPSAFDYYAALSAWYREHDLYKRSHSRLEKYEILRDFLLCHRERNRIYKCLINIEDMETDNLEKKDSLSQRETGNLEKKDSLPRRETDNLEKEDSLSQRGTDNLEKEDSLSWRHDLIKEKELLQKEGQMRNDGMPQGEDGEDLPQVEGLFWNDALAKGDDVVRLIDEMLILDMYLREKMKKRPTWATDQKKDRRTWQRLYREQGHRLFPEDWVRGTYDSKRAENQSHIEKFSFNPERWIKEGVLECGKFLLLFDYSRRDPLSHNALIKSIAWDDL